MNISVCVIIDVLHWNVSWMNHPYTLAFMPLKCRNPLLLFSRYRFDLIFGLSVCKSLFLFCFWKKKRASHLEKRPQSLCIKKRNHNMTCSGGREDVTHAERPGFIWHTHLNVCSVFTRAEISKCQNWIIYQGNTFQRGQWWGGWRQMERRWVWWMSEWWARGGRVMEEKIMTTHTHTRQEQHVCTFIVCTCIDRRRAGVWLLSQSCHAC